MNEFLTRTLTQDQIHDICAALGVEYRVVLTGAGVFHVYVALPPRIKPEAFAEQFWAACDALTNTYEGVARPLGKLQFVTEKKIQDDSYLEYIFDEANEPVEELPAPHLQHWIQLDRVDPARHGKARRVVFYSYKGGVGRTTALVLTALVLAQHGHRVAVVDFDLEAPGIGAILLPNKHRLNTERDLTETEKQLLPEKGLVDFLVELPALQALDPAVRKQRLRDEYLVPVGPAENPVQVLTAGNVDEYYPEKLAYASLEDMDRAGDQHNPLSILFTYLEEQFEGKLEYILVDSRTGIADIGGSLLFKFADAVCALFYNNDQNVEGMKLLAQYVYRDDRRKPPEMLWVHTLGDRLSNEAADPAHDALTQHLHAALDKGTFTGPKPELLRLDFVPSLRRLNRDGMDRHPPLEEGAVIRDYATLATRIRDLWSSKEIPETP